MISYTHLPERSGIYQIINNITQKSYIGYASRIRQRIKGHISDLKYSKHPNDYLQKAWIKYGIHNFKFVVLQECPKDTLCLYEDYWVRILGTLDRDKGYNIKPTDPNGIAGQSQETIEKLKISNKNARPSENTMQKAKEYWSTHTMTEDHKKACREGLKKVDWYELRKDHYKKVINIITKEVYESTKKAIEVSGIPRSTFLHKLQGSRVNDTNYKYL